MTGASWILKYSGSSILDQLNGWQHLNYDHLVGRKYLDGGNTERRGG
jgi:hypothetical protein